MWWTYKITAEKTRYGFYRIPKNCTNADFGNFEELLKNDSYREVKSAIVNWFNDKYKNINFWVVMNGLDMIHLSNGKVSKEIYFGNYQVIDEHLIYTESQQDWLECRFKSIREAKIKKIRKRYEQKSKESHIEG